MPISARGVAGLALPRTVRVAADTVGTNARVALALVAAGVAVLALQFADAVLAAIRLLAVAVSRAREGAGSALAGVWSARDPRRRGFDVADAAARADCSLRALDDAGVTGASVRRARRALRSQGASSLAVACAGLAAAAARIGTARIARVEPVEGRSANTVLRKRLLRSRRTARARSGTRSGATDRVDAEARVAFGAGAAAVSDAFELGRAHRGGLSWVDLAGTSRGSQREEHEQGLTEFAR